MQSAIEMVLANALTAGLMGLVVYVVGRCCRWPALVHCLWLLVLIKLITPPVPVPVAVPELAWLNNSGVESPSETSPRAPSAEPAVETTGAGSGEIFDEAGVRISAAETDEDSLEVGQRGFVFVPVGQSGPSEEPTTTTSPDPASYQHSQDENAAAALAWQLLPTAALAIWLCGAAACLIISFGRAFRFHRLLRLSTEAPATLQDEAQRIAAQLGLRRAPRVLVIDAALSPMLWCFFSRAKIVLPQQLLDEVSAAGRETLLAHELAHYRRRDHWVRFVELLAAGIYWWHPVVWLAVRELRRVEEDCCDAWVVARLPEQRAAYARALVDAVRFLSDAPAPLPAAASGISQFAVVENRIRSIMTRLPGNAVSLSPRLRALVVILAVLVPFVPMLAQETPSDVPQGGSTESKTENSHDRGDDARSTPSERKFFSNIATSPSDVRSLAISRDGQFLVAAHSAPGKPGAISVWNLKTRTKINAIDVSGGANRVAISPNGKLIAHTHGSILIKVRRLDSLDVVAELPAGMFRTACLAFSPDGKHLAATSGSRTISIYHAANWQAEAVKFADTKFQIVGLMYSPDGSQLVASGGSFVTGKSSGRAIAWHVATRTEQFELKQPAAIMRVAFSPDGKKLATACLDGKSLVCNAQTGELLSTIPVRNTGLQSVSFSPDGTRLAVVGGQSGVSLFDVEGTQQLGHQKPQIKPLRAGLYSPDGKLLVVGGEDQTVQLLDSETLELIQELRSGGVYDQDHDEILAVAVSADGRHAAAARGDHSVTIHDTSTGATGKVLKLHTDAVSAVAFSPTSGVLASAGYDGVIKIVDGNTHKVVHSLSGHDNWICTIAFSPDGRLLASGAYDKTIRIWEAEGGKQVAVLTGHTAAVRSIAFSPDGNTLFSTGSDRSIRTWNVATFKPAKKIAGHDRTIRALAVSPDGKVLASAGEGGKIKLWNLADGSQRRMISAHDGIIWSLAFSPGGKTLASGGFDGAIKLWDPGTGRARQSLTGHGDIVAGITFTPDASAMISGSYDKTLRIWKATQSSVRARYMNRVYIMDGDGSGFARLADDTDYDGQGSPIWSPDGKKIIFDAWRESAGERFSDAHVMLVDADGGNLKNLGDGAIPRISPDGKKIVFCRYGTSRGVWLMDIDGSNKKLIDASGWGPAWSPDGKTISFTESTRTGPNIFLHDVESGRRRSVLSEDDANGIGYIYWGMRWSRDGKRIAAKVRLADDRYGLMVTDSTTSEQGFEIVYQQEKDFPASIAWLPDDRRVAFAMVDPVKRYVRLYSVDGQMGDTPRLLEDQPDFYVSTAIDWSPDARRAVLVSRQPK